MIVEAPRSGRGPGSHRPALALSTASLSHRQVTVTVAGPGRPGRGTAAAARPCHAGPGPPAGFSHGDLHARQPASEGGPGARPHWSRPGRRRPRPGPGGCGHGRRPGLGLQVTATRRRTVPRWASDTGPAAGRPRRRKVGHFKLPSELCRRVKSTVQPECRRGRLNCPGGGGPGGSELRVRRLLP